MEQEQILEEKKIWYEDLLDKTEEKIKQVIENDINTDNITYLGKLIDIHKDIENEKYWKEKIDMYRDRDYYEDNNYDKRERDNRRRYMDNPYDTSKDSKKSLKYMLNSVEDFFCMLMEGASSSEEVQMIKETARKISEM